MTRRRWRITVLAALATLSAVYPITSLFIETTWLPQAFFVILLVAGLGLVGRGLTRSRGLVVLTQVLVTAYVVLARSTGETFALLVPTPATLEAANSLGVQALETINRYSAPAPLNEGITFCLVVAVGARRDRRRRPGGHLAQPGSRRAAAAHGIPHHGRQR